MSEEQAVYEVATEEELPQDMEYTGLGDEVTTDAPTNTPSADVAEESMDDRIRRIIAEDLATTLEDDKLSPIQHYVRQHAATVLNILIADDQWLTYLQRNLAGINIRALDRQLADSKQRAPIPQVVRSYVPGSLRLMAEESAAEDGTRVVELKSVEMKEGDGADAPWVDVDVIEEQKKALASVLVNSGAELGVYQYLTSDVALEEHQKTVLEMHDAAIAGSLTA